MQFRSIKFKYFFRSSGGRLKRNPFIYKRAQNVDLLLSSDEKFKGTC
jgi:hypothetical protein